MAKEQTTKLVSVRIDIDLLKALDDYAGKSRYVNRSYYINLALRQFFVNSNPKQIFYLLYTKLPIKKK